MKKKTYTNETIRFKAFFGGGETKSTSSSDSDGPSGKLDTSSDSEDSKKSESSNNEIIVNKVFKRSLLFVPNDEAERYLKNAEKKYKNYIMTTPPIKPNGGEIYLFKPNLFPNEKVTILDGYNWRMSRGHVDKKNPNIR